VIEPTTASPVLHPIIKMAVVRRVTVNHIKPASSSGCLVRERGSITARATSSVPQVEQLEGPEVRPDPEGVEIRDQLPVDVVLVEA